MLHKVDNGTVIPFIPIDLHVEVPAVKFADLSRATPGEASAQIRLRIIAARERQQHRFSGSRVTCNARLGDRELKQFVPLDETTPLF